MIQGDLAARFGVSRIPLREALRVLAGEGLLTFQQGAGATVTRLDMEEVDDLYNLRLLIEPQLAGRIIENCSDRALADLTAMIEDMGTAKAGDSRRWLDLNFDFHLTMYRLVHRSQTLRVVEQLLHLTEPYMGIYVNFLIPYEQRNGQHEHRGMVRAIADRDARELETVIRCHLDSARCSLTSAMRDAARADNPMSELLASRRSAPPSG